MSSVAALRASLETASPGTTIELADGEYSLMGQRIVTSRPGSPGMPIMVRAQSPGAAVIRTGGAEEAFQITQPYYVFQDLTIEVTGPANCNSLGTGSCHAYKLDSPAHDIVIRGGRMDLHAGAESGVKGASPGPVGPYVDNVLIENTEIFFRQPSQFGVAEGIDAVGVRAWVIRGNTIHGIRIAATGTVAWGVVLKGNSQQCIVERNVFYDNDVAVSIGGTTASAFVRDGPSPYEHQGGVVRNNISVGTRDVALYLERARDTSIEHNTLLVSGAGGGTSGAISAIDVRYVESTASIRNNILDQPILDRDGGSHAATTNLVLGGAVTAAQFVDLPQRDLRPRTGTALASATIDRGSVAANVVDDLIGRPRPTGPGYDLGAYEMDASSPAGAGGLALVREDNSGLPGMYGGAWGVADFDGDGDVDIAVIGHFRTMFHSSDNPGGGSEELRLYSNITLAGGPIRFQLQATLPNDNGNRGAGLAVGDFDGNGRRDVVVQMRNGGAVAGFLNRGGWVFDRHLFDFANNSTSLGLAATDINRDGRDDVVFNSDGGVGGALWYTWNSTTQTWQGRQRSFPHHISYGGAVAAGDLTGDGFPEIAIGGNSNQPFGSHDCGDTAIITSGERLQYGQTHRNLGGENGFALPALAVVGAFGYKVPVPTRLDIASCHGMDNAQMAIADLDGDGANDVVIAGSSTGQNGPIGRNGQQYDFAVLFNDGSGSDFAIWENEGPQSPNGTTNGGVGNLDFLAIAIGDLSADGRPDVFVQGHRRDYNVATNPYVFEDVVFVNNGDRTFRPVYLDPYLPAFGATEVLPGGGSDGSLSLNYLRGRPRYVAEGGAVVADFNGDGRLDLVFSGAELPYHTNGSNFRDYNDQPTLKTYVLASGAPLFADGFEN